MFEKEAEEYVRKIRHDVINWDGAEPEERFYNEIKFKQAYLAGAELGYNKAFVEADKNLKAIVTDFNKANEWHKVADGDLPDNCRYVWTNVGAGYHDDDGWWDDCGRLQNVIAWCEPKFEE